MITIGALVAAVATGTVEAVGAVTAVEDAAGPVEELPGAAAGGVAGAAVVVKVDARSAAVNPLPAAAPACTGCGNVLVA